VSLARTPDAVATFRVVPKETEYVSSRPMGSVLAGPGLVGPGFVGPGAVAPRVMK